MPVILCSLDIRSLLPLVTAAEKKKDLLTGPRVVHAVARTPIYPQLPYTFAYWLAVAEQSILEPVDTSLYPRLRLPIT